MITLIRVLDSSSRVLLFKTVMLLLHDGISLFVATKWFWRALGNSVFRSNLSPSCEAVSKQRQLNLIYYKGHFYQNYTILHKKRGELHNYMTTMNIFLSTGKCIYNPVVNYMFKVDSRNTRIKCKICSKLRIKTSERRLASFWYLYC